MEETFQKYGTDFEPFEQEYESGSRQAYYPPTDLELVDASGTWGHKSLMVTRGNKEFNVGTCWQDRLTPSSYDQRFKEMIFRDRRHDPMIFSQALSGNQPRIVGNAGDDSGSGGYKDPFASDRIAAAIRGRKYGPILMKVGNHKFTADLLGNAGGAFQSSSTQVQQLPPPDVTVNGSNVWNFATLAQMAAK